MTIDRTNVDAKSDDSRAPTNQPSTEAGAGEAKGLGLVGSGLAVSLTVGEIEKSLAWYRDVLGLTVEKRFERGGRLYAVSLRAGVVALLITQDDGARGEDRAKGVGFSMRITTSQSIDAVARRIVAAGGVLDSEPMDTPFGMRVFRLQDPDGFRFAISSEPPPRE